jgi:diguanylate cyclase (GGDEF)-like protein
VLALLEYIELTSDLVGVVDAESRITYLNAAARKRLGVGDATDLTTADVFPQHAFAQYYTEIRPQLLRTGVWNGEVPVVDATRGSVPMLLTIVARVGPGGEISALVTHGREVAPDRATALAGTDELTRLPQRAVLEDRMHVALSKARRSASHVGVMLVDIDGLKDVNDTHGHAVGDQIVRGVAHRLHQAVREADTVARIGGTSSSFCSTVSPTRTRPSPSRIVSISPRRARRSTPSPDSWLSPRASGSHSVTVTMAATICYAAPTMRCIAPRPPAAVRSCCSTSTPRCRSPH